MKRKKKNNAIQNKQERQHRQNEFFKKLKQIMALLGDDSAFDLLNKRRRLMIYHTRIRPFKVINPTEGKRASKAALQMLNNNLTRLLQHTWVELDKHQIKMSLYDFSIYAETLFLFWRNVARQEPDVGEQFYACFPIFEEEEFDAQRLKVFNTVERRLETLAWLFSDFTTSTTRFVKEKLEDDRSPLDLSAFYNNYVVEQKEVETELLEIGGHRRTVFQVCLNTQQTFAPLTITPEKLGLKGMMQKFPLKVFMQKHVLVRMEERLGKPFVDLGYLYIVTALLQEPLPAGKPNSFLFPMTEGDIRLGYLKADIIGDKLVVRTFLFVTNNGTPEGKKLQELAGLAKLDKAYLGIDRLHTFIASDIKEHQQLRELFNQVGCGGLLQLNYSWMLKANKKQGACADRLACYLGLQQAAGSKEANNHTEASVNIEQPAASS
ncbi:hypothetical protein [Sunxiuqinia rutila]|uniref:hypothetical protein n=1 Tax=Sunxiuqinia rutila TaxID=1397841 RepID=UPI003D36A859